MITQASRLSLGIGLFVALVFSAQEAGASQCSGIRVEAKDVVIETAPATPCILVTVEAIGCGDKLQVAVNNTCAQPLVVPPAFVCSNPENKCSPVPVGQSAGAFPVAASDGSVGVTYSVQLEGKPIEIRVKYREEIHTGTTSENPDADEGACSVATNGVGHAPGPSPAIGAVPLLAGLAVLARRRRRA